MEFWRYYRVIRRRLWVIALLVIATAMAAYVVLAGAPPSYRATATMMLVDPRVPSEALVLTDAGLVAVRDTRENLQNTARYLVMTRAVAERIAPRLGEPASTVPTIQASVSATIVETETGQSTSLLRITAVAATPARAVALANAAAASFVEFYRDLNARAAGEARRFIDRQLRDARARLERADAAIAQYKSANRIISLSDQVGRSIEQLSTVESQRDLARVAAQEARARLAVAQRNLRAQRATRLASQSIVESPVIQQIRTQLTQLQIQLAELRQTYTDQYPKVIETKQQIAELEQRLRGEARRIVGGETIAANPIHDALVQNLVTYSADLTAAQARAAALGQVVASMEGRLGGLPRAELALARLTREQKVAEQSYLFLSQKAGEALIRENQSATASGSIQMVDAATASVPVQANVVMRLGLAVLLSGFLGVGLALFVDYLDTGVRAAGDVERAYGVPVLAAIPVINRRVFAQLSRPPKPLVAPALFAVGIVLVAALALLAARGGLAGVGDLAHAASAIAGL